jgi:chromosome segregation protein
LTKLEVHGFKAFADHTVFQFDRGVTAIVGPNGCGKSNVSDSVRWVLGEQRARVMRGAKMEDVIFHGSSARKPVNMAEVSLHFDNSEGDLPVPFKEVVITRRLMRTGESEYLLNRAPCRLRDIQDLVRGTGLGADSGVVIESKMIDALLSDRPDDRRELFEEAAGVGLYRDRRRSAERRLDETTVDLSRLDDLISEVQSQVRSLARQRRRAERHAELTSRRFTVEIALATREMAEWREELEVLAERLTTLRAQLPDAETAIATAEEAREQAHGARAAAEAKRAEVARLATEQRERTLRLERELAVAEERQRSTEARRTRAEQERIENEAFGQRLRDDREKAVGDRETLEAELATAGEALAERVEAEEEARAVVQRARQALEQLERDVRQHRDQARRLELDREGATRDRAETQQRLEVLERERAQLDEQFAGTERELVRAREQLELLRAEVQETQQALEGARVAAAAARTADAEARALLARSVEQATSLEGQVSALERLERERVGPTSSAPTARPRASWSAIWARRCTPWSCATRPRRARCARGTVRRTPVPCSCCRSTRCRRRCRANATWPRWCGPTVMPPRGYARCSAACRRRTAARRSWTRAVPCSYPARRRAPVPCSAARNSCRCARSSTRRPRSAKARSSRRRWPVRRWPWPTGSCRRRAKRTRVRSSRRGVAKRRCVKWSVASSG